MGIRRANLAFAALVRLGRDGVTQEALQEELNLRAMRRGFRGGIQIQSFDSDEESSLITALAASVQSGSCGLLVPTSRRRGQMASLSRKSSTCEQCKRSIPDQDITGGSLLMSEARLRTASAAIVGDLQRKLELRVCQTCPI